jgi:hypothetical protein
MAANIPLLIQRLPGFDEQTLVLAHLALQQSGDKAANPGAIKALFISLNLPVPKNISQHLAGLRAADMVMQPSSGRWAVTPEGVEEIRRLMEGVGDEELSLAAQQTGEPSFAGTSHHLIPAEWAPGTFRVGIARFLEGHPFESNVFGMSRYPDEKEESDPVRQALTVCRGVCAAHKMEFHLASDRSVVDSLLANIAASMWASKFGILLLEDLEGNGLNYNAIFEAGGMIVTGRRCLILKDESVAKVPTDIVGNIYKSVDLRDPDSVTAAVRGWITNDLALG